MQWKVHLVLLTVSLIYGANFTIAKEAMPYYVQPFGFIFIRVVCATIMFFIVHSFFIKEKVARADLLRLLGCGIFGVAVNQLFFFKGLNMTTPINAALMMIIVPIIVLVLSSMSKVEPISVTKIIGILLGAFGAFLIIYWGKKVAIDSSTFLGDLFVLINASSYAFYLVLVKPLMTKYHPLTVTKWMFLFGSIFVIPAGFDEFMQVQWQELPLLIWMCIIYVIVFTTFLAYLLNVTALKKVNPSLVGIYIYLQPVIASLVALAFGRDELTVIKIVAALFIFSGVYLVSKRPKKAVSG